METFEDSGNREAAIWELTREWTSREGYAVYTFVLLGFN